MNPKTVAYIHELIIDCVSITFEDSINARALEHKSTMVDAYTKMKPDSFKLQLQAVLTTYYQDIKGIQGASGCHKSKVVKRRFEDQEDDAGDEGADDDAAAAVARARAAPADASGEEAPAASTPPGKAKKPKKGAGASG